MVSSKAKKNKKSVRKSGLEEQVVQRFPDRCPYCDQPISYASFDLKPGENPMTCPSCKQLYIKVIPLIPEEEGEPL